MSVKLHGNTVLYRDQNGITLSSCGWKTVTTKTAINNALKQLCVPKRIHQIKGEWFLNNEPFNDGMLINFVW